MHRLVTVSIVVLVTLVTGCGAAGDLGDDARARADEVRDRADDVRARTDDVVSRAEGARAGLEDLADRADEIGDRATWCGAAVRLGNAIASRDAEAAEAAAQDLRADAPAELTGELTTVLEAAARAQAGDPSVLTDREVQDAALTVLETARDACGVGG